MATFNDTRVRVGTELLEAISFRLQNGSNDGRTLRNLAEAYALTTGQLQGVSHVEVKSS